MEWLYLATGFTGSLTLLFLWRCIARRFKTPLTLSVQFSPKGGGNDVIVKHIKRSRHEVLIRAATFTSKPVAESLVAAKTRGVNVDIVLDRAGEADEAEAQELLGDGITPLIDAGHPLGPTTIIIVDAQTVITGSFDNSLPESDNTEHILVIQGDAETARAFRLHFLDHKAHAKPVERKKSKPVTAKTEQKPAA